MKTPLLLTAAFGLLLNIPSVHAVNESLAPADPHRSSKGKVIGVPLPGTRVQAPRSVAVSRVPYIPQQHHHHSGGQRPQARPTPPPPPAGNDPFGNLTSRLGLTAGKPFATGRVFNVLPNGATNALIGSYQIMNDGRLMIFPVGTDRRLDVHSGSFFPGTGVIGARFTGLNLTSARNTGGGIINLSVAGTGNVTARIQTQFENVGNATIEPGYPIETIRFVPL